MTGGTLLVGVSKLGVGIRGLTVIGALWEYMMGDYQQPGRITPVDTYSNGAKSDNTRLIKPIGN